MIRPFIKTQKQTVKHIELEAVFSTFSIFSNIFFFVASSLLTSMRSIPTFSLSNFKFSPNEKVLSQIENEFSQNEVKCNRNKIKIEFD
mgnify:CR=1 FL=1